MVIGHHAGYYVWWSRFGGIGVDLFFVLSGYLISGLLFSEYKRTGRISISRFLIRRGFKIYPGYFAMVLAFLPVTFHWVTWADLTFMGSYFPIFWGHGWSLSVEEHFYFALPVVLVLSLRFFRSRNFGWIPWAMPALALICLFLRYRFALGHSVMNGVVQTHLRIDSLFAGVTLGWLQHFRNFVVKRPSLYGIAGLVALVPIFDMESYVWSHDRHSVPNYCFLSDSHLGGELEVFGRTATTLDHRFLQLLNLSLALRTGERSLRDLAAELLRVLGIRSSITARRNRNGKIEIPVLRARERLFPSVVNARPDGSSRNYESVSVGLQTAH